MPGDTDGTGTLLVGFPGGGSTVAPVMTPPEGATPAPQAVPTDTPPSSGQQAGNVADYEALLKEQRAIQGGMQKTIDALKAQVAVGEQQKVALQAQITELQAKQTEAGSEEITLLRQKVENLESEKAVWEGTMQAKEAEMNRVVLLASEYPAMAGPLLQAKAVPQAKDDAEFRAAMDRLVGNVTAQAEAVYKAQIAGARPAVAPQTPQLPDAKTLKKQLSAAIKDGKPEEIARLQELWQQAMAAQFPSPSQPK